MIVFEIEQIELEYHPEYKILEFRWIKVVESGLWEALLTKLIDIANAYQIESMLFDASYAEIQPSIQAV